MFEESEKIFATLDEEDKEPEMLDQRSLLMDAMGIQEKKEPKKKKIVKKEADQEWGNFKYLWIL